MKVTILTYGSRGDVQPFLALSLRLMEAGHSVKLAAPARFKDFVTEWGVDFVPLAGDPQDLSRRLNDAGLNFLKLLRELLDHAVKTGAEVWRQTEESCRDADLIIHTFTHAVGAHSYAREHNIPDIHIQTFPVYTPTGDYPNVTLPDLPSRTLNRLTHQLSAKIAWWMARSGFARIRRRAGLHSLHLYWPFEDHPHRPRTPILCAWSPSVLPASKDWPARTHVTGYFFANNRSYQPPAELLAFLENDQRPICVSFGSMVNRQQARINQVVEEAIRQTNNRGIVLTGWSQSQRSPSSSRDLLYLEAAPHEWLLPRCKLLIHHGGAGTTAAGLRAGIPSIVIPFLGDQPFWGRRVHAIGAGPRPLFAKGLTVEKLAHAIRQAESESVHHRAQVIGQQIGREDGVGRALQWIEEYSNDFHRPR